MNAIDLDARPAARQPAQALPAYPIESVANALNLLLVFRDRPAIRLSEVSDALGVARSTAHRLLAMLQHFDFVTQDPRTRAYHAGSALVEIGQSLITAMDIRLAAKAHLASLASAFGETVHLCALSGPNIVFLSCIESHRASRARNRTGTSLPAHVTAAGKAILATSDDQHLAIRYPDENLATATPRSIKTRTELWDNLRRVRERGFAINRGESEVGMMALASVVRSSNGDVRGAITIAGPELRMMQIDLVDITTTLRSACKAVGDAIHI